MNPLTGNMKHLLEENHLVENMKHLSEKDLGIARPLVGAFEDHFVIFEIGENVKISMDCYWEIMSKLFRR